MNGYPIVLPPDVPNTPNLTWAVSKTVGAGAEVDGFTATTRGKMMVEGESASQVTRQSPAARGGAAGAENATATKSKQAITGSLPTPSFLADTKQW